MTDSRISRVLQVLALAAFNPEPTRLKEIGSRLGMHPSMVSRIVAELIKEGLLAKSAYRSVIPTPALAVLGIRAGKNHPLSRIAREILHQPIAELGLSCEFAAAAPGGLYHFYQVQRGTPQPEPLWRSDLAAVIYAARGDDWEKILPELELAAGPGYEQGFAFFRERLTAAQESRRLINYHAGRFRQITMPLRCGSIFCALSVAGSSGSDQEKIFFEISRLAAKIRSLYDDFSDSDA